MTPRPFDLEATYDEHIAPLMRQIEEICHTAQMPMLATFCLKKTTDSYHYCTTYMGRHGWAPPELVEAHDIVTNGAEE